MGIFDRFKTVVSSNINDLISKSENPEKMLNQLLIDMNEQMIESKKAVAMAIADEKKLEREAAENKRQAEDWEKKAMLAVRANRDDLAKEALLRKQEYEGYATQLQTQWVAQKDSVEKLKVSLRELQNKIDEASRKKNILIARAKRAEAQEKIKQHHVEHLGQQERLRYLRAHVQESRRDRGARRGHQGARRRYERRHSGEAVRPARILGRRR